jgi:2-polyprenyl-3-methyl-5-hydroxy-6-metoxy-1,4-benzoquinol methylase
LILRFFVFNFEKDTINTKTGYTTGAQSGRLFDVASRLRKAAKMQAVLNEALGSRLSTTRLLDVGCSSGIITNALAQHVAFAVGVDPDADSLRLAAQQANIHIAHTDGIALPFAANSFDLAICAQVYEHAANQQALADEIYRVLKPGGVVFFSGPNRLAPIEDHYHLPLLSWFPRPIASAYVRLLGRGHAYEEKPLFLPQLRHLWRRFEIEDLTLRMIQNPARYHLAQDMGAFKVLSALPFGLLKALLPFLPNYNWLLTKR